MTSERSPVVKVFLGIWLIIDGARKVFLNLVFFLIIFLIVGLMFFSAESFVVQTDTALMLRPAGRVVEEYTGTPLDQALQKASEGQIMETRLRDLVSAIRRAKNDSRISHLFEL